MLPLPGRTYLYRHMKAYFSIIVFAVLAVSSVVTGTGNYIDAKDRIASDLNRALVRALAEKGGEWVTEDTLRVCRQLQAQSTDVVAMLIRDDSFIESLSIPELRSMSYVSFAVVPQGGKGAFEWSDAAGVSGDTVLLKPGMAQADDVEVAFRGNADCSFATVLGLSDQRLPVCLMIAAMLWGVLSILYMPRHGENRMTKAYGIAIGGLRFDDSLNAFYNAGNEEMRFTPMQYELMRMFFCADGHKLSKDEICSALWPGKPDASETLYTLIRRLKQVIEPNTGIRIESERGRAYKLRIESS